MARAIAALACSALLLTGCGLVSEKTVTWDNGELSFRYPAAWTDWGPDEPISLMRPTLLVYVGTVPVDPDEVCTTGRASASCDFSAYEMAPGGVAVGFVRWNVPSLGPPEGFGEPVTVGGREARFAEKETDRGTLMLQWAIADPYASYLAVVAEIQAPGEDRLRDEVEALIDSIQFTAPS